MLLQFPCRWCFLFFELEAIIGIRIIHFDGNLLIVMWYVIGNRFTSPTPSDDDDDDDDDDVLYLNFIIFEFKVFILFLSNKAMHDRNVRSNLNF